MVGQKKIANML